MAAAKPSALPAGSQPVHCRCLGGGPPSAAFPMEWTTMLKIAVILGTTRHGRFGEKPAQWILGDLQKNPDIEAELLDLRDYDLPFFNEAVSPGWISEPFKNEVAARWTKKIAENDGFVMVAPQYNRGYTA